MSLNSQLVRGTIETIILEVLAPRPMYGYEICRIVDQRSGGQLALREGSLYPALHKLERSRLLLSRWVSSAAGRRRKYYELSAAGRRTLAQRRDEWRKFSNVMDSIVEGAHVATA
jgi:PadR family transcriptional regulator, regulatory protein PadR